MKISQSVKPGITVQIVHSDLMRLLDAYVAAGIILRSVCITDELTATFTVDRLFCRQLYRISQSYNAEIKILHRKGGYWHIIALLHRPILLAGIALLVLLSVMLPKRILVVSVEGNTLIPEKKILEAAENAGICFGASRREIRSEQVKNRLLEVLPQLQWIGINTRGCVAVISVKERSEPETVTASPEYGSIVAVRDGVVQSLNVTKGNALCAVGQAVKAGDLLVSGYTDCGLTIRVTGAEGEVYAQTLRNLETVVPLIGVEQGAVMDRISKYSLIIGKKRIKFYKDSGIYDSSCDKMYKEYFLTLPGGFELPVAIAVEEWCLYENSSIATAQPQLSETLQKTGEAYLLQEMVAGQILSSEIHTEQDGALCRITGSYRCLEMIGRLQQEEIAGNYGKSDGENS